MYAAAERKSIPEPQLQHAEPEVSKQDLKRVIVAARLA